MNDYIENNTVAADYNVKVRTITFIVTVTVVIFTLVFCIRIYSEKKESIAGDINQENFLLRSVIIDHLNYSKYLVDIVSDGIKNKSEDLHFVHEVLRTHFRREDFNMLFGWRKYSWVDKEFKEVVTSNKNIITNPKHLPFIKKIVTDFTAEEGVNNQDHIFFYNKKSPIKGDSLKIIRIVTDDNTGEYSGALILSYDIGTLIRKLNNRKNSANTNFILLDKDFSAVAQSKSEFLDITDDEQVFFDRLEEEVKRASGKDHLFELDMFSGQNYYLNMPNKDFPFYLVVSIDKTQIKQDVLKNVTVKFAEVSVYAFMALIAVISIYKRETMLRSQAEIAKEKANHATKAKTDFLVFTAHEVRSPLGFVLTGSEIMKQQLLGPLPPVYVEYAEGIHRNSKTILDFITDILDENQILEGKFRVENSINSIKGIIAEAIQISITRYNQRCVEIESYFTADLPFVECDKNRMLQVFGNLIGNAIKYSEDKTKIKVTVELISGEMLIKIIDRGIGMNAEQIKVALSPYGTIKQEGEYSVNSYGLGLPIVKMLLDAQEMGLSFNSKLTAGTEVMIKIPSRKLVYRNINE